MQPIKSLFNSNSQLQAVVKNVQAHQQLQQLWLAAASKLLTQHSQAGALNNGNLLVYADSAIVANKIKLMHASLLMQLQNLQKNHSQFADCKVTAISIKVQVKSAAKTMLKPPRKLSSTAANSLNKLVNNLGDSALASKLASLANKQDK